MTFIQLKYYQLLLSVTLVMFYISLAMVNRRIRRVPISVHFFTFKGNLLSRWLLRYRRFHVLNWFVQSIRNRLNIVDVIFARMLCERKKISSLHHSLDMNWKLSFLSYHYGNPLEYVCMRMIQKKTVKQFWRISIFAGYISTYKNNLHRHWLY